MTRLWDEKQGQGLLFAIAGGKAIWLARLALASACGLLPTLDFRSFPRHAQETSEVLALKIAFDLQIGNKLSTFVLQIGI